MKLLRPLLEVELDPTLIASFGIPSTALNGNFLQIQLVEPGDYRSRFEAKGPNELQVTADGTYPVVSQKLYSFTITMKDPRLSIYQAMRLLSRQSRSTVQPGIPIQYITVRDYALPEPEDTALAGVGVRAFTTRQCLLFEGDLDIGGGWYDEAKGEHQNTGSTVTWTFHDIKLRN